MQASTTAASRTLIALQQPDIEKALDEICLEEDRMARGSISAANPNAVERLRAAIARTFDPATRLSHQSGKLKISESPES